MNKFEQGPVGTTPEQKEQDVEKELNEYGQQMEEALENLMVELSEQKAQPSDIRTAMKESLTLSIIFNDVLKDLDDTLTLDALQPDVDQKVRMLGLDPSKFNLYKFHELIEKNR